MLQIPGPLFHVGIIVARLTSPQLTDHRSRSSPVMAAHCLLSLALLLLFKPGASGAGPAQRITARPDGFLVDGYGLRCVRYWY